MHKGPLIPTLSLASGIAISAECGLPWWFGAIPISIAIILYLFIIRASKDPVATFRMGKWHIFWVIFLFAGIGLIDESLNRPETLIDAFGGKIPVTINCEVIGIQTMTYGERIDVVIEGTNGARARIRTGVAELSAGDVIKIPSKNLIDITRDTTKIGRKIEPMLRRAGILYSGRVMPKSIEVIGTSSKLRFFFINCRNKIETNIERSHLNKATSDFLNAILMGDKLGLNEETRLTFASGGMAHVLALSGLHIGILSGFLVFLMWPIKLMGKYKWSYAVAILMLWCYVALTGMAYSSVRACIMTSFAFIGIIFERKNIAANALCSACLLILLADPTALFDAGFQLSVVCVGSLLAFASRLNPIGHRHHPILYYICGAIITTIVATVASLALTSYYFGQIPLMFLPVNVILLPILPLYLSLAVVFVGFLMIGIEVGWLVRILDHGYSIFLRSVETLSYGTEFVINYQIPLWGVAIWMLILASGAYAINRKVSK